MIFYEKILKNTTFLVTLGDLLLHKYKYTTTSMNFFSDNIDPRSVMWWVMKTLPWIAGAVIFWLVSYLFFAPQFDDKSLGQGDIAQYSGMSADIHKHREATGEDPQWTGGMFSGMPAYLIDMEYPTQDVKQTVGSVVKIVGDPMNMIFFAMLFMMIAVVLMGVNPWIGIIAGLAYGLSTYFFLIIDAGHITKMWALVYAPPLVGAVWYALRRNMWVGAALAALFGSLELGANHPQISYYFLFACIALWISEFVCSIIDKRFKKFVYSSLLLLVAALLAIGSNFAPLWYTMQHRDSTARGTSEVVDEEQARKDKIAYNTMWSYGKAESLNMLVPNYMGSASADVDERVEEFLKSDASQDALVEETIDEVTAIYQEYDPSITRDDIVYYMNNDPTIFEDVQWVYSQKVNGVYGSASNYWGTQPYTAGPTYLGAAIIFLAIVGVILAPGRYRWWLLATTLFAILLAWGSNFMPFYELMYDILPGYNNFRTVSMALVVVEWSVPLFAVLALWQLASREVSAMRKYIAVGVSLAVIAMLYIVMIVNADFGVDAIKESLGNSYWAEQMRLLVLEVRSEAFVDDAWRSLLYIALTAAVVVMGVVLGKRLESHRKVVVWAMVAIVGVIVTVDIVGVDKRYMNDEKWHSKAPTEVTPTAAYRDIHKDKTLGYRVFDIDHQGSSYASNFCRSVDGYHGAKLGRYNDVLNRYIYPVNPNVLNMLNTRYVIVGGQAKQYDPFGAAWFVGDVKMVDTPAEALDELEHNDLWETAIVERGDVEDLSTEYSGYDWAEIELVKYAPNYLKYEYEAPEESLCVFSEIYYPEGWTAYVDGKEADYFAVDYILRGMVLPEGKHIVEWRFRAPNWGMATTITGIASWLILLSFVALAVVPAVRWVINRRSDKKKIE